MKNMDFWRSHVLAWQQSGESASSYAETHGVTTQALKWWRWKLGTLPPPSRPSPVPARFVSVIPSQRCSSGFELRLGNGVRIGFESGVDVAELVRVARALEGA